ncbi:phosphate ABC transporter permease subunit PstC [uncultured Methanomethylovorans sp.]|uniref:phosphate ABC transporter permease subunit PstC n=1 Tax=uncultured Methanomethylovorans sp. TaxID=183759 RepID=UPI002AA5E61F|nr:phosphate ABC transporter permease subunit PstC [uncultured Methanomethylovorans sp.]
MMQKQLISKLSDISFSACAIFTAVITVFFVGFIFYMAYPVFQSQGLYFLYGDVWDYSRNIYGIRTFIAGTFAVTFTTLLIALPISFFTAIFLAEYAPKPVVAILRPMIELLVGIPSVVYGIFGLFVLKKIFVQAVNPFLSSHFGFIPLFVSYSPTGEGVLLASVVLAIMILPTVTAIAEDSIRSVPFSHREASFALGANHWQTIKKVVLRTASKGMILGAVLGMMRAMGETMAIVMLLGNIMKPPRSLLDTGYAMTSKILNDITYHLIDDRARSALFGIAAVLFLLEIIFVGIARKIGGKNS